VRVSATAAFSKCSVNPASLIDFGGITKGTKKTCAFMLENKGILDFDFLIYRADQDAPAWPKKRSRSGILLGGDAQGKAVRHQPLLGLFLQARINVGMFTVYPGFGSIPPGGQQMITVDCCAEPLGTCEEHLSIDITDR
ncbi:HYDIN protein, partial [Nyctibius bracteatus]|nr:HYDIN protein [Nyctibius bracteatus]